MFWPENEDSGTPVYTQHDLNIYTHILYLEILIEIIFQRRKGDMERSRETLSDEHLSKWQFEKKTQLRRLCREHGILFSLVSPYATLIKNISILLGERRIV